MVLVAGVNAGLVAIFAAFVVTLCVPKGTAAVAASASQPQPHSQSQSRASSASSGATWMKDAFTTLRDTPLNRLVLPGAHDAFSFNLSERVSPELPPWAVKVVDALEKDLPWPKLYEIIDGWAKTQGYSPTALLEHGIRYFDVRTCWDAQDSVFRYHHLLMSHNDLVKQDLRDVRSFMDQNPGELVVLFLSHFAGFSPEIHAKYVSEIVALFGDIAWPRAGGLDATFGDAFAKTGNRAPVLLFYQNATVSHPLLWNTTAVLSDLWSNTPEVPVLWARETSFVKTFSGFSTEEQYFYPQWILTENTTMIIESAFECKPPCTLHQLSRHANGAEADSFFSSAPVATARVNVLYTDWVQETDTVTRAQTEALFPCFDTWPTRECARNRLSCSSSPNVAAHCPRTCGKCESERKTLGHLLPGKTCSKDSDCASKSCGSADQCMAYITYPISAPCGENWQCESGACANFQCVALTA